MSMSDGFGIFFTALLMVGAIVSYICHRLKGVFPVRKAGQVGLWTGFEVCVACGKRISTHYQAYNEGVCPFCGNKGRNLIPCEKKIARKVYTGERQEYEWEYKED